MKLWSNYVLAATIDEAVQALAHAGGSARPVAGGTDLLLELQQGRHEPVHTLVDVSTIPDLQREAKLTLVSSVSIVEGGYHDVTLRSTSTVK